MIVGTLNCRNLNCRMTLCRDRPSRRILCSKFVLIFYSVKSGGINLALSGDLRYSDLLISALLSRKALRQSLSSPAPYPHRRSLSIGSDLSDPLIGELKIKTTPDCSRCRLLGHDTNPLSSAVSVSLSLRLLKVFHLSARLLFSLLDFLVSP